MNTIVIDCGASFIKGALIQDGIIIRQMSFKAPLVHMDEDVLEVIQITGLLSLVRRMIIELGEQEKEVFLCISNEMHGFLLAYEDGNCYTDYISWQKEYGAIAIEGETSQNFFANSAEAEDILDTGMPLRAGLPSCNLLYLARQGYLREARSTLYFYTLGDYILRMLSGKQPQCHVTNAAATGLYSLKEKKWNKRLISMAGGSNIVFPVIGEAFIAFELEHLKVKALPAIGDQQAALLGAGLETDSAISFNLGTGAQVSRIVEEIDCSGEYQIRPYFEGKYLKTLPHLPAGRALNVYFRFFKGFLESVGVEMKEEKLWEILLQEASSESLTLMQCDLSFFENPLTKKTEGSIDKIGEYTFTVGNLVASVIDQMGTGFVKAADIILQGYEGEITEIVFSGGLARKIELLRDNVLKHYSPTIKASVASNETLLGLYRYADVCEKRFDLLGEASVIPFAEVRRTIHESKSI